MTTGSLYIQTIKKCHGPTLVMLHGWGWHSGVWQPLIPRLSQYYQLVLIDLPGFGRSELNLEAYTFPQIAAQILSQVPNQAHWLGWSLGGMLAQWIAIHFPEKVQRLITVTASPRFLYAPDWPGVMPTVLENFSTLITKNYETTLTDFLALQLRGNPKNENLFSTLKQEMFSVKKPQQQALLGGLALLRDTDLRTQLASMQCDALHIFGSHDTLVPAKVATLMPTLSPKSHCVVMQRIGHMPFLLKDEFIELIKT